MGEDDVILDVGASDGWKEEGIIIDYGSMHAP